MEFSLYSDMLDHVKSLVIDAVEMTGGLAGTTVHLTIGKDETDFEGIFVSILAYSSCKGGLLPLLGRGNLPVC